MADNRVLSFIDQVNAEREAQAKRDQFQASPIYKNQIKNDAMSNAKRDCYEYIFKDFYKNSMPLSDSYKCCNDGKIEDQMKDFINRQTANQGIDVYMRDACTKNPTIKKMVESVDRFVKHCFEDVNVDNMPNGISIEDLDWNFDDEKKAKVKEIANDANLDQVAKYVAKNVQSAIEYEKQNAKEKKKETEDLEFKLSEKPDVKTEDAVNDYLHKNNIVNESRIGVYQPRLFESVIMACATRNDDMEESFNEAVGEYTLLNMNKALRVGDYTIESVNNLAKRYASGKVFSEAVNDSEIVTPPTKTLPNTGGSGSSNDDIGKKLSQELSKIDTNKPAPATSTSTPKFESAMDWRERLALYTNKG